MADEETSDTKFDQVEVPEISLEEMFDDAFTSISRDGAGLVEVSVRLQKALQALAINGEGEMREIAEHHSRLALKRSKHALSLAEDLQTVEKAAGFSVKDLT